MKRFFLTILLIYIGCTSSIYAQLIVDKLIIPDVLTKSKIYDYSYYNQNLLINHGDSISFYLIQNDSIKFTVNKKNYLEQIFAEKEIRFSPKIKFVVSDSSLFIIDYLDTVKVIEIKTSQTKYRFYNTKLNGINFLEAFSDLNILFFSTYNFSIDIFRTIPQNLATENHLYGIELNNWNLIKFGIPSNFLPNSLFVQDSLIFYIFPREYKWFLQVKNYVTKEFQFETELTERLRSMKYKFIVVGGEPIIITETGLLCILKNHTIEVFNIQEFPTDFLYDVCIVNNNILVLFQHGIYTLDLNYKKLISLKQFDNVFVVKIGIVNDNELLILTSDNFTKQFNFFIIQ